MLKTFIHKPEPFQAIQWTEDNLEEIREFIGYGHREPRACEAWILKDGGYELVIDVSRGWLDSWLRVRPGGYVTKKNGCIYGWNREEFERVYEEIREKYTLFYGD